MSIANKMSLSAPSDKAKRQGPSSCHVLAGAWGKTPSGAGKYFPNRHTRKHRFHQMVKSAVATACMLLACLCQIATASRKANTFDYDRVIIDEVRKYIQKNENVMGIDQINDEQLNSILLEGQDLNEGGDVTWCKLRWKNVIKTKIHAEFGGIFEERRKEAAAKAERIAREEAREEAQRKEAQRKAEEQRKEAQRKAEEQLETEATAALDRLTQDVFEDCLNECVGKAAKAKIAADAANKEIYDQYTQGMLNSMFLKPFKVLKKNEGKGGKIYQFQFNKFSNVDIQAKEQLASHLPSTMQSTGRYPTEGPVISYKDGKSVIIVSGLEKDEDATFPKGFNDDEYNGCCYKVSGSFLDYKKVWTQNRKRVFLRFWVSNESSINENFLETYYASLLN